MKIDSSEVYMQSLRSYSQSVSARNTITLRAPSYTGGGIGFYQNFTAGTQTGISGVSTKQNSSLSEVMEFRRQIILRLIDFIMGKKETGEYLQGDSGSIVDMRESTDDLTSGSVWTRVKESSLIFQESESTSFTSTGCVKTADGRTISFNVELGMSRQFLAEYTQYETADYVITDPLVINTDSCAASVTDAKFLFDLDCDGNEEEISFTGQGSGFLALDKNGDGEINNGSELFGAKSGNGFAELAEYDDDGNGWIDENDDIFSKLKVWTRDENGRNVLMDLKSADVGAICLKSAKTDFSLTDENNFANAFIRSTGIFLRESGGVGTVNQIDLTS